MSRGHHRFRENTGGVRQANEPVKTKNMDNFCPSRESERAGTPSGRRSRVKKERTGNVVSSLPSAVGGTGWSGEAISEWSPRSVSLKFAVILRVSRKCKLPMCSGLNSQNRKTWVKKQQSILIVLLRYPLRLHHKNANNSKRVVLLNLEKTMLLRIVISPR